MIMRVLCVLLVILVKMWSSGGLSNVVNRSIDRKTCREYPPTPTNVTCRVSASEAMTCSWLLGVDISCKQEVIDDNIATLYYKSDDHFASWTTCPHQKETYCYWSPEVFTDPWELFVKVTVNSTVYNVTKDSGVFTFYQDDILEPGPVTNLKMTMTSEPRCAELDWVPSNPLRSFRFIVSYTSTCTNTMETSVYYNGTSEKFFDRKKKILCNLNPYTDYTFSVQGRLIKNIHNGRYVEQGFWSNASILVAHTDTDIPDVNPITSAGLYELSSITRPAMDGYSFLTLYWTPLIDCNLHDDPDNVMYYITAYNRSKSVQHPAASTHIDIPNHKILNITLLVGNSAGSANSERVVDIFPASFAPSPSELIVEYNQIDEHCQPVASMVVNENRTVYSDIFHKVVWCKGTQESCQEPVKWKELTRNETLFTLPGNPCVDVYRYGIVTHGYHRGQGRIVDTGIYWEPCIYQAGKAPEDPPENVHLAKVRPKNGFTVEWTPYDCKITKAYITHYTVTYCVGDGKTTCKCFEDAVTSHVSRQSNSYTVSGLTVGSLVCVWVRGVSKAGQGPPNQSISLTISERTHGDNVVIIAIVSVIITGGAIFAAILVISHLDKRYKNIKSSAQVQVPWAQIHDDSSNPMIGLNHAPELSDTSISTYAVCTLDELDNGIHDKENKDAAKLQDTNEIHSYLHACDVINQNVIMESQKIGTNPVTEMRLRKDYYVSNNCKQSTHDIINSSSTDDDYSMEDDQFGSVELKGISIAELQACASETECPQYISNEDIGLKDEAIPSMYPCAAISPIEAQWNSEDDSGFNLKGMLGDGDLGEVDNESKNKVADSASVELDCSITNMNSVRPDTTIAQNISGYCVSIQ